MLLGEGSRGLGRSRNSRAQWLLCVTCEFFGTLSYTEVLFPQVTFHGFGRSVHGDIHTQVLHAIMRFQDLELLLGLVGVRDDLIVIGPCGDSEYSVFVRVPCVDRGLTFFGVQGSAGGLNQLQPPLQLSLGLFYQCIDVS